MKKKILIFLALLLAVGAPLAPSANAQLSISIGDRPYYHGAGYWHRGYYWVWVPGHYSRRRGGWVPGHYVRRGGYDRSHARFYFRQHRDWDPRWDSR
jgi:hypothetical protein